MKVEMKAPSPGESITEVRIANWIKKNGDAVREGENVLEIDSDKATLEVVAPASGKLVTQVEIGATIPVGTIVAYVDTEAQGTVATPTASAAAAAPAPAPAAAAAAAVNAAKNSAATLVAPQSSHLSPAVKKMVDEKNLNPADFNGSGKGGRLTKGDLLAGPVAQTPRAPTTTAAPTAAIAKTHTPMILKDGQRRVTMTTLRAKIAERLKQAQNNAAILTTFNEVDLAKVNEIRKQHKDSFKAKHGVGLGFMSFFTRACVLALKEIPEVNAYIDGNDLIYNDFINVGVAVGSDRGLVVPVLRNAQNMSFVDIEKEIARLAGKARDGKLSIPDMSDGTFTISNGGTYGSLLSTPILNPPQSGILGMHKIMDRPMVVDGTIQIRPMMYLALSYDHRLIDGKGAVTFLVKIKERLEKPEDLGMDFL